MHTDHRPMHIYRESTHAHLVLALIAKYGTRE